jgi:glycosyltransferase involved in cell wall biosynthesis
MELKNKNILLISPEPWDHIFVSKHHYAVHLANENKVYFLNPPSGVFSLEQTENPNLKIIHYRGFVSGIRFLPGFVQRHFMRKVLADIHGLVKSDFDVIWSFDNSVFYDFSIFSKTVLTISHIVDLNQNFQTAKAARSADICFCTSDLIMKRLKKFNSRVFKIGHGYNASIARGGVSLPGTSPTKVVYAGNLAMPYIDWVLLERIVSQNPNLDFIFIGPNVDKFSGALASMAAKRAVSRMTNTFFTGRLDANDLASYYAAAHVLIVAYQEKFQNDQANPHKMMEYLGSGKVIVATWTAEYALLYEQGLIAMSQLNSDYPGLISSVVSNIISWNAMDKERQRIDVALDNTYSKQIKRAEACMVTLNR